MIKLELPQEILFGVVMLIVMCIAFVSATDCSKYDSELRHKAKMSQKK